MRELIIIGSGAAGMTAAIYAARAGIDTVILEKQYLSGGQINLTDKVDNYPGLPDISGQDLANRFREQVLIHGVEIITDTVERISEGRVYVKSGACLDTRAILIAVGADNRRLGVEGEERLIGHGVSYCAHCDAGFYKDKEVAVIGGGNSAMSEALHLSRICSKVHLIVRANALKGESILQKQISGTKNIMLHFDTSVNEIVGKDRVEAVRINESKNIFVDGIFIAIGRAPQTDIVKGICERDEKGYILTDSMCRTTAEGIFAAGDCIRKPLRQIITAAADGAYAVSAVQSYLLSLIK